ncbi:MAG TPA: ATP synthase F0 subunit B [Desulfobulbus sp.]|nr:ATP synthase F0 subunit B [Desulfobulbus sp.]
MRAQIAKIILPVLLALLLGGVTVALATQEHGAAVHGEAAAEAQTHETVHAAADGGHGAMAEATHGAAVEGGHGAAVEGGAENGHGGRHGETHNSLSPAKLKDLFWRTVNFIALVVILVVFLAKPIGSGLTGRQQQIREELEALEARRDEAERSYKEFEARLAGMEQEMERVVEKAIAQAENEKARILAEAEKAAEDIKRQAEAAVQAELVDARRVLLEEVADKAAAMAEELIVKNLTPEDQVAITEQYLDRVGAVQ